MTGYAHTNYIVMQPASKLAYRLTCHLKTTSTLSKPEYSVH